MNKKVARFNKGENPSPRLKTDIVSEQENNLEETSETEVINESDHVTTRKIEPSDEFPEENLENKEADLYLKLGTNENNHRTMVNRWDEVLRGIRDLKDTRKLSTQEYQGYRKIKKSMFCKETMRSV